MNELLRKYLKSNCSLKEFKEVIKALTGFENQKELSSFMKRDWGRIDENVEIGNEQKFESVLDKIHHEINLTEENRVLRFYKLIYKYAAILLAPILIGALIYFNNSNIIEKENLVEQTVPTGMIHKLSLSDGSIITMNSESKIEFPISFKGKKYRKIRFEGEGYFDIQTNKEHGFIVQLGQIDVKVLGTKFNIYSYKDENEIAVVLEEGKVSLSSNKTEQAICCLVPNEMFVYNKKKNKYRKYKGVEVENYLAWKEGRMIFENESFDKVLKRLERRYGFTTMIEDSALLNFSFTASFKNETLDEILKLITLSSPITYKLKREKSTNNNYNKRILRLNTKTRK